MRGHVKILRLDRLLRAQAADFAGREEEGGNQPLLGIDTRRKHAVGIRRMHRAGAQITPPVLRAFDLLLGLRGGSFGGHRGVSKQSKSGDRNRIRNLRF